MKRILYIEDNEDMAEVMGLYLNAKGYQVYHHSEIEGYQAYLKIVQKLHPDLILSDIYVPNVDGRELCKFLKANSEFNSIPYVLYSAMHLSQDEQNALCGDAFIAKPFDLDIFGEVIHRLVA